MHLLHRSTLDDVADEHAEAGEAENDVADVLFVYFCFDVEEAANEIADGTYSRSPDEAADDTVKQKLQRAYIAHADDERDDDAEAIQKSVRKQNLNFMFAEEVHNRFEFLFQRRPALNKIFTVKSSDYIIQPVAYERSGKAEEYGIRRFEESAIDKR